MMHFSHYPTTTTRYIRKISGKFRILSGHFCHDFFYDEPQLVWYTIHTQTQTALVKFATTM